VIRWWYRALIAAVAVALGLLVVGAVSATLRLVYVAIAVA